MRLVLVQKVPGLSGVYGTQLTEIPVAGWLSTVVVVVPEVDDEDDVDVDVDDDVELTVVVGVELFPSSLLPPPLPPQAAKRIINMPSKIKPVIFFIVVVSLRLSSPSNFRNINIDIIMRKSNNLISNINVYYKGIAAISQFVLQSNCFYFNNLRITKRIILCQKDRQ